MSHFDKDKAKAAIHSLLTAIHPEDSEREGLQATPDRVARAFEEYTAGYAMDPREILSTTFEANEYDQMIFVGPVSFYSMCEHHLAPFFGQAFVAYVPSQMRPRVVGLSKLARVVQVFAKRLQIQEKMTQQIASSVSEALHPYGVGVRVEAKHLCMCSRGVQSRESWTSTTSLVGVFKEGPARQEFFHNIDRSSKL